MFKVSGFFRVRGWRVGLSDLCFEGFDWIVEVRWVVLGGVW